MLTHSTIPRDHLAGGKSGTMSKLVWSGVIVDKSLMCIYDHWLVLVQPAAVNVMGTVVRFWRESWESTHVKGSSNSIITVCPWQFSLIVCNKCIWWNDTVSFGFKTSALADLLCGSWWLWINAVSSRINGFGSVGLGNQGCMFLLKYFTYTENTLITLPSP